MFKSKSGDPQLQLFKSKHTMSKAPIHKRDRNKKVRRKIATASRRKNRT